MFITINLTERELQEAILDYIEVKLLNDTVDYTPEEIRVESYNEGNSFVATATFKYEGG